MTDPKAPGPSTPPPLDPSQVAWPSGWTWEQNRVITGITGRVTTVEELVAEMKTMCDHVVSFVDRQERVEKEKHDAAEARDSAVRAARIEQRQFYRVLMPILIGLLGSLIVLTLSLLAKELPAWLLFGLIGLVILTVIVVIIILFARARFLEQANTRG